MVLFICFLFILIFILYKANYIRNKYKNASNIYKNSSTLMSEEEMFNVERFNNWFNDKNKPKDIYAHSGIFLRLDKLSNYHFEHYFESCGILNGKEYCEGKNYKKVNDFHKKVREDWFKKIDEN